MKIRLSIPLSKHIYDRLQKDADFLGISQATFATLVIGHYYEVVDLNLDTVNMCNVVEQLVEKIKNKN